MKPNASLTQLSQTDQKFLADRCGSDKGLTVLQFHLSGISQNMKTVVDRLQQKRRIANEVRVKIAARLIVTLCSVLMLPAVARADWQAVEKVKTYAIQGKTGPELYASIGERGLGTGLVRAIAYTSFKLTWTRKYEPQAGGCTIVTNKPKLIITYTLPKPAEKLPSSTAAKWQTFIAGVQAHERIHGDHIKDMVKAIEVMSVGLSVPNDPDCKKIRTELTARLGALSQEQRQKSRDFDSVELSNGGNVHQLILNLVNGG
jgi:predicted secreted Zn-dependent protease